MQSKYVQDMQAGMSVLLFLTKLTCSWQVSLTKGGGKLSTECNMLVPFPLMLC